MDATPLFPNQLPDTSDGQMVIVETARRRNPPDTVQPRLIGGGALIVEHGRARELWFAGYAASEDMHRADVISHFLRHHLTCGTPTVHCAGLWQQLENVARSHGLRADGKTPFKAFDVLKALKTDMDCGEWVLNGSAKDLFPLAHQRAFALAQAGLEQAVSLEESLKDFLPVCPDHLLVLSSDCVVDLTGEKSE